MINYDFLQPAVLTGYVRELPAPAQLTLNQWLPDQNIRDIEAAWDVVTKTNRVATFRSWDAETPVGKRDSFARNRVSLPPLGQKLVVGEYERILLEQVRSGGDNRNRIVEQIYTDADTNTNDIYNRMELARGDVLVDGKFTLAGENGLTIEVDYQVNPSHLPTAATLWSDHDNSDPLSDMSTWSDTYTDDAGEPPAFSLTSRTVMGHLLRNKNIRAEVGSLAGVPSQVTPAQLATLLDAYALPQLRQYNTQLDVDGTSTRPIPANRFTMMPADPTSLGFTAWGITAEALELATSTNPQLVFEELPGLVGVVLREGDPVRTWTKVTAVGMPIIKDPRKLWCSKVLA